MDNVFKYGWMPWRYPRNWWGNIKLGFRQWKWAYQRATRGFADCDVWNMDGWLLDIIPGALNQLAEYHCGWPGDKQFPNDEDWTQYLKDMAQKFYSADENNDVYPSPERDKWWDWMEEHDTTILNKENPYAQSMLDEYRALTDKRMQDFAEAWSMMGDVFFNLWD